MDNPISYNDLFDPNLQSEIDGLVGKVREVQDSLAEMIKTVKEQAKGLGDALSGESSSTKGGRDNTKAKAAEIEALYDTYQKLGLAEEYVKQNLESLLGTQERQNKAIKLANTANNTATESIARLRAEMELAKLALEGMESSGKKNVVEFDTLSQKVKYLGGQIKSYNEAIKANLTQSELQKRATLDLETAYSSLSGLVRQTGVNLNALLTTKKQDEVATKNGIAANTSLTGSYNQLYAQYNLIKNVLNAMGAEMRNNAQIGKVWEAEALRIMDEMKAMQEATGKNTLSVGDYGKALNGLNIATQQVLREMPTLANSAQQFFIAISNNVPIFVDNFKRAQQELGGFGKALGATMKSLFSWNTVLLVVLTVLPKIAKAIHDKKKAQEEDNKETEKALTYTQLLADAEHNRAQSIEQETGKLKFLTEVLNDHNRSWDDRIKAAQIMKKEWKEEFKNFSEEQIAAGEATESIKKLTEALVVQAEAKAFLNEIGNLSIKHYDLEMDRAKARAKQMQEEAKLSHLLIADEAVRRQAIADVEMYGQTTAKTQNAIIASENAIKKQREAIEDAGAAYRNADMQMQEIENTIDNLKNRIKLIGLDTFTGGSGGGGDKDSILSIPSYYNDALKAIIDGMEDGVQKEVALLDYNFKVQREKRMEQQAALEEMRKKATEDEKKIIEAELSNLALAMVAEEQNYLDARKKMYNDFKNVEVEEEPDYEEEARKTLRSRLAVEQDLRDAAAYKAYETAVKNGEDEIKAKETLNQALLGSEREYWETYLKELREQGLITVEEYNKIMAQLSKGGGKQDMTVGGSRRRGRKTYRNITEAAFAISDTFGEKDSETGLRKVKDEYLDFADAINSALETSMEYMDEWMDKRIEMAEIAVEAAEKETESAKTALEYEMEARANGYANNVELARQEYEEKLAIQQEAIKEQERLEKIQEGINTAQQVASLITATANIWSAYSAIPFAGQALAIAATALMWGSFAAAKVKALEVTRSNVQYGEGMTEYLNYGGSHASGNDIDFGRTKDGTQRRVERGEVIGVVNKKNVNKYGANNVMSIIQSLNNGTFERQYTKNDSSNVSKIISVTDLISSLYGGDSYVNTQANRVATAMALTRIFENHSSPIMRETPAMDFSQKDIEANYEMAFSGLAGVSTDLSRVERGIQTLVEQGETKIVQTATGRIEYKGHNKRIIRNG